MIDQAAERLAFEQRHVAVEEDDGAGRAAKRGFGLEQGVRGPELRLLDDGLDFRSVLAGPGIERGAHLLGHVTHNDRRGGRIERRAGLQHVADHGFAADVVEHLGQLGLHAGALAGGENHNVKWRHRCDAGVSIVTSS